MSEESKKKPTVEERLKKLEGWAAKVGPVITQYQKKVNKLTTKVTEQKAEIRALERRLSNRPPSPDDILAGIYGDRVKCLVPECGKTYSPNRDYGHFCSNGAWVKHDDKNIRNK